MTLILGLAVYINYAVSTSDGKIKATDVVKSQSVNYGDAQLVSTDSTSDYFTQARIDRIETLKNIMNGGDSTEEEKKVAEEEASAMTGLMESESKVETLVKAAGFEDCVVYLDGDNANIVVKTDSDGLVASEAAQIKDILLSEVSVANENIRIYDVE